VKRHLLLVGLPGSGKTAAGERAAEVLGAPFTDVDEQVEAAEGMAIRQVFAERGEPAALVAMKRYEDRLARALAHVVNLIDPDVIVLGGGLSKVERIYGAAQRLLPRYAFSDGLDTPLRRPKHGDASGVRGAAWLWGGPGRPQAPPVDT